MIEMTRTQDTFVLRMRSGENRFNPTMLAELNQAFDEAEAATGPVAVVLTGEGKFFSNGLDLEWMAQAPPGAANQVVDGLQALYIRLLESPFPVVAAINGHAFAAGAMLALACDSRAMRADRGFVCLPEVDIDIPFSPGMSALLRAKLSPLAAHEVMLTGLRLGSSEAMDLSVVDRVCSETELIEAAVSLAEPFRGKSRSVVQAIKRELYKGPIDLLRAPIDLFT